ncbi:PH domain-containing protein [Kribbella sp. CA-253562]|uniref:PH domain-containing protein n=1 Tax=Kribbella sp. CA-253562 TaxID=3239942 RepID=UPI003D8F94FF
MFRIGLVGATLITAALGVSGALASALGWYPCVEIREESLVVRNPLRDTIVPWRVITRVDDDSTWVRLQTPSGWIRCFGVERTLADQIMTSSRPTRISQEIESQAAAGKSSGAAGDEVLRRWRRPTGWELTTSTVWVLLTLFTLLAYKA